MTGAQARIAMSASLLASVLATTVRAQMELPDLSGAEAPVRAKIERLHDAVERAPRDGEAWGRLGMALDAHDLYDQAKIAYRRASALDGADFRWAYHLGCLLEVTQPNEA